MRRTAILLASIALALLLAGGGVALAITNGTLDYDKHPNVGALVGTFGDVTYPYCSGTLISPTVFLTAAHCDISDETHTDTVNVTFDFSASFAPEATSKPKLYSGTFVPHPQYARNQTQNDIAVVLFKNAPIKDIEPAQLPTPGQFDSVAKDQQFTAVGYGGHEGVPWKEVEPLPDYPGGQIIEYADVREYAVSTLNSVASSYLHLSQNDATNEDVGGTCSGDSGGPNFLGAGPTETDIIAGTTITGDAYCHSTNVVYRLDTDTARDFLSQFEDEGVTVP